MRFFSLKGNEELALHLHEEANEKLESDLLLVEHEETKNVIQNEIDFNNKRIEEFKETLGIK